MPAGDDRYQVQTPAGSMEYFRCDGGTTDRSCVIDDHRPAGNLRRISSVWYYYPGDGTRYAFHDTAIAGRHPYTYHLDSAGHVISAATWNGSTSEYTKIETANSNLYFAFAYDADGMTAVHINAGSGAQLLDLDITAQSGGWKRFDRIKYASAINTIDTDTFVAYTYNGTTRNMTAVTSKLDSGTTLTIAEFDYDGSDRLVSLKDAKQDLSMYIHSGIRTDVTFNVEASGNPTTAFVHNTLWVRGRGAVYRVGGMASAQEYRDDNGRVTCRESDDSRMTKYDYTSSWQPVRTDIYGKTGDCTSGGTLERQLWHEWDYNESRQSWRPSWTREKSQYSPASSCTGSLPSGCRETKYEYVSSTDDRIQWVTQTGNTRGVSGAVSSQVRKHRSFYYGLDTGTCASSGDWYTGLVCRTETQSSGGTVYERTHFTYVPSSTYAGLPKTVAVHRNSSDSTPLTTTYASHNAFGTPLSVTAPSGMVTTYTMNGWNAPTQIVEDDALLDDDEDVPVAQDVTTGIAYNNLRAVSVVTLPKGNKQISKYLTGSSDYARLKSSAIADSSSNLLEIMRYVYDKFGNVIEDRTLDSINSSTPCADEDCSTYDVRRERKFNALRQITEAYLHSSDTSSPPDGTQSYTYTNGQLTAVSDYRGTTGSITYDSQGRTTSNTRDTGGIAAQTQFSYDLRGRTATVTSPTSMATHYEHDDFGQLVLERSRTRGDLRYAYDIAGNQTERKRTTYKATTETESTCYTHDWIGRLLTADYDCDGSDWTLYYDAESNTEGACPSASKQNGHLAMMRSNDFTRVLCYHPQGPLYASYQIESSTWSNSSARGTQTIFDLNGNIAYEVINAKPSGRDQARHVQHVYQSAHADRIDYVRTKLDGGSWSEVTSSSTDPTYFSYGGLKTLTYANGITETNERDYADRIKRRRTSYSSTVYTDINLSFDLNGNVTQYDDSTGYRHLKYDAAMDKLDRLRCLSRTTISSCSGSEPWADEFLESFDYDASGNRTNRRYGAYNTADDDAYTYVSGPTDIISSINYGGSSQSMNRNFKGELTKVYAPDEVAFTYNEDGRVTETNDKHLGEVDHAYSYFGDRYMKISQCNVRTTRFFYRPDAEVGASPYVNLIDLYDDCESEYPRHHRAFIYLDGRPIAVAHADQASLGAALSDQGLFWMHTDHLGTPVLVTNSSRVERWRWENDPFGRAAPVEYTVSKQDVSPDEDSSGASDVSGLVWSEDFAPSGANAVRVHFADFDVNAGTTRTGKDYVQILNSSNVVVQTLTGDLGSFWGPWVSGSTAKVRLYGDAVADGTGVVVIDELEYTTATNGRFVMHLRMPGQIWDEEVRHAYNYQRWYKAEDGRYLSPDPIGLAGGEPGYVGYANANPVRASDATGTMSYVLNSCASHSDGRPMIRRPCNGCTCEDTPGWACCGLPDGLCMSCSYVGGYWKYDHIDYMPYKSSTYAEVPFLYPASGPGAPLVPLAVCSLPLCLESCEGGAASIERMCRRLRSPVKKALCWSVVHTSKAACHGFCYSNCF